MPDRVRHLARHPTRGFFCQAANRGRRIMITCAMHRGLGARVTDIEEAPMVTGDTPFAGLLPVRLGGANDGGPSTANVALCCDANIAASGHSRRCRRDNLSHLPRTTIRSMGCSTWSQLGDGDAKGEHAGERAARNDFPDRWQVLTINWPSIAWQNGDYTATGVRACGPRGPDASSRKRRARRSFFSWSNAAKRTWVEH